MREDGILMNLLRLLAFEKPIKFGRRIDIKFEHVSEIAKFFDEINNTDAKILGRVRLWSFLEEHYPECREGQWKICFQKATAAHLQELL